MDNGVSGNTSRASGPARGTNYWHLLAAATDALDVGDFAAAERRYRDACDLRETSPGRVFVTEKIADGMKRLFSRRGTTGAAVQAGRWNRSSRGFVDAFVRSGEEAVREGVRRAELRPEDDAETNQPILESALFLVARSRLFQEEPASAVPLLKGLFRTAFRTGRPFAVDLVRHDLPLTEEDRLWLARKGAELVDSFVEQGHLRPGGPEAEEWAQVFLQLLHGRYFGATGRLEEERAWLEAVTADRLLVRGAASVDLYRAYLEVNPEPGPRADEARVRMLELLANIGGTHFPVPRYGEALRAMQSAGLASGSAVGGRYEEAIARLEYRRPEPDGTRGTAPAWASVAVEPDGRVAVVFWWDNEPRDVAFWTPGEPTAALEEFLAPCAGRILAADEAAGAAVGAAWIAAPAPWTAEDFVTAVLESRLPATGAEPAALSRLALAETGPWRAGWRGDLGHTLLTPPQSTTVVEGWQQGEAGAALRGGLLFLAVRSRVADADLALRAGFGELARRGDPAAAFLYDFLVLDSAADRATDATFAPWTLPLLWTRPDPLGWVAESARPLPEGGLRPDLGRSDLTIVTTGDPAATLAAWGEGKQRWRVVLDRLDRLGALAHVARDAVGPVTLIPPAGTVHDLGAALALLEDLVGAAARDEAGLLPLFHWIRLVETHNGDLLDHALVRPRPQGVVPLYDRYRDLVAGLPTENPALGVDGSLDDDSLRTWAGQFSQRVRKAGLVAGTTDHVVGEAAVLDSLWGVFEGSDAAWVFLDSAAVHWRLHGNGRTGIGRLHELLHSRGRRHLSVLSAAAWCREDLEELLASWLQVYGAPYTLTLTDTRAPVLRLADRGIVPEAAWAPTAELAGQVAWVARRFAEEGPGTVRLPAGGRAGEFWSQVRSGDVDVGGPGWHFLGTGDDEDGLPDGALVIPVLASLPTDGAPPAERDDRAAWAAADAQRATDLAWRRGLCALEIAAVMAGRWRSVDVLDTRWWRLLRPVDPGPGADSGQRLRAWDGEQAARLATVGGARTFDLPGTDPDGPGGAPDGRVLAAVGDWLARRGETPPQDPPAPAPGVRLVTGDADPAWSALLGRVARAWEEGRLEQWLLVVADQVPAGAAHLVGTGHVAGLSTWRPGVAASAPAPVMWVGPEDLADPDLRRLLGLRPPAFVFADDLADWLPGPEQDAQDTAMALRAILDLAAPAVVLRARALTPSWAGYLAAACGAASPPNPGADSAGLSEPTPWLPPGPGLDAGHVDRPAAFAGRLRTLLARLREVLAEVRGEEPKDDDPRPVGDELLPVAWLARLAGLSTAQVIEGVRLLRWAARLNGDSLSAADEVRPAAAGHTLLVRQRFTDLEPVLAELAENLALLLPLWLDGAAVPGLHNRIDLEYPPVRIAPEALARVDAFLAALAGQPGPTGGLVYHCPRGQLHAATRLVGWDGGADQLVPAVQDALDVFRGRIRDVLTTAVETPAGFRVETGLSDLRDDERTFLGLGVELGLWRWLGPAASGAIHLVDLLTVAESPTARVGDLGWDLLRAQATPRLPAGGAPDRNHDPGTRPTSERPRLGPLRRLWGGGEPEADDLEEAVARVHEVTAAPGDPAFVMLRGMLGTGRHEALVRGLARTWRQAADPGAVTVYCPDEAVAAAVTREFLRHGAGGMPDIRVPERGEGGGSATPARPTLARPDTDVVVMCEVQRFEPEVRYRIAQAGRGRLLVMTGDAVASVEPWEHLFLTTPRANDILTLEQQRAQAKDLWEEVRDLAPDALQAGPGTRRTERGHLESGYAANLVQSLAKILAAHEAGTLPAVLRVAAPLPPDLEYLGHELQSRGWIAVPEDRLEALLLPGPREILAALSDLCGMAGELRLRLGRSATAAEAAPDAAPVAGGAGGEEAAEAPSHPGWTPERDAILPRLLGPEAAAAALAWLSEAEFAPDQRMAAFVGRLVGLPWANTFLRRRESRRRCEQMLAEWGDETVGGLLGLPLWEAWWAVTTGDLGAAPDLARRPLALLAETGRTPGARWPGGVYLCHGTEPVRQHYEILGRIADSGLVLYQERSPLPGDAQAP